MSEELVFEDIGNRRLRLWLFSGVKNASELLQKVQSKTLEPECSLMNASLIADLWFLRAAAFKALADEKHGRLKTHSLHGELVFNLSGSRHIGESLKLFGLSESTTSVLVGRFDTKLEEEEAISGLIDGKLEPLSSLSQYANISLLQQHLKCSPDEEKLNDLPGALLTRMAVRDC